VIVVAPRDELFDKTVSNMQEAVARGARIVLISNAPASAAGCRLHSYIEMPGLHPFANPLVYAVPLQLIAYHTAVRLETDVDQPRNLAKSVTVE
jgi:glucosamine--fructose-6-phosphate aminotransferase (isomerizing)